MGARGSRVRLRQAVLVAAELELWHPRLRAALDLDEPFRDPGVGEFGLANVVFALGDCFRGRSSRRYRRTPPAGRYSPVVVATRYMVIFDLEDLEGARERALGLGARVVWQIDLPDISGTHCTGGHAWGDRVRSTAPSPTARGAGAGRGWTGRIGAHARTPRGVTLAVSDPVAVAARWERCWALA